MDLKHRKLRSPPPIKEKEKTPALTGPYLTGTTQMHIIDPTRSERHALENNRELLLTIWYPATISKQPPKETYVRNIAEHMKQALAKVGETSIDKLQFIDTLKTHSYQNAQMAVDQQLFPVLIFSPGFGAPVILYTSILEDLASHGYVVIGINYPYVTNPVLFPNGTLIKQAEIYESGSKSQILHEKSKEFQTWTTDIQFLISELKKIHNGISEKNLLKQKLDLQRIGVFGHSFGGSVALKICEIDDRCKAGVSIEGKLYKPINQLKSPFMFLVAPHTEDILKPTKDLFTQLSIPLYLFEIEGTDHGSFTDIYFHISTKNPPSLSFTRSIEITRALLLNFFGKYLKNDDTALDLESLTAQNPEITLLTNVE